MARRDKINYYLDIADVVSERGTCLFENFGALIVKNDEVVSSGYTGTPRGRKNCCDIGSCYLKDCGECRAVHAEANAIISASRKDMLGSSLYLSGHDSNGAYIKDAQPCSLCKRFIINAGIDIVIIRKNENEYTVVDVESEWAKETDE